MTHIAAVRNINEYPQAPTENLWAKREVVSAYYSNRCGESCWPSSREEGCMVLCNSTETAEVS